MGAPESQPEAPRVVEFWAEGTPASYSRDGARFGRTPPANVAWRGAIAIAFRIEAGPGPLHVGPVHLTIEFFGARASCDGDNLAKEVQDALNGIAYEDDRQIRRCTWEIADWRQEGMPAPRKGAKKTGARILLTLYPHDPVARARAEADRAKARAGRVRRARDTWGQPKA